MSRTKFAIKNSAFGFVNIGANLILGFISRTVFIYFLGKEYLGINGLLGRLKND